MTPSRTGSPALRLLALALPALALSLPATAQLYVGATSLSGIGISGSGAIGVPSFGRAAIGPSFGGNASVTWEHGRFWASTGFGLLSLKETHRVAAPHILGDYRNIQIPMQYFFVPIQAGLSFPLARNTSFGVYAGANLLVERRSLKNVSISFAEERSLPERSGSDYHAKYTLYQSDMTNSAAVFSTGAKVSRSLGSRVKVDLGAEANLGFSMLNSSVAYVEEARGGGVTLTSFGSMKGDAVRILVGFRYRIL